ncbi:hypothetical protein BC937DRAFT_91679 [Endogone sp. FLAS-F59071]|nr:hypothetical protein BC937DRAFT_91679 [Endogone sp. FLAS-F59071]|eukprot:RUS16032.1 hypothetical protein BC937DRAFT_91679 [Endogone sp. FLAS-F59071]
MRVMASYTFPSFLPRAEFRPNGSEQIQRLALDHLRLLCGNVTADEKLGELLLHGMECEKLGQNGKNAADGRTLGGAQVWVRLERGEKVLDKDELAMRARNASNFYEHGVPRTTLSVELIDKMSDEMRGAM